MSLNTTKQIKSVTYNGTEIPLAVGSSSSGETATVNINLTYDEGMYVENGIVVAIWETTEGMKCSDLYDISSNFTLSGVLINSKVFLVYHVVSGNNYYIEKNKYINSSGITEILVPNIDDNDSYCPVYAFEVLNSSASITVFLGRYSG